MPRITSVEVIDVRFPTSLTSDGSDAMNKDGDYSAAYVVLHTDDPDADAGTASPSRSGAATTCASRRRRNAAGPWSAATSTSSAPTSAAIYRELQSDTQLRWLGPDKGVVHLALAAVMNAVWDLAARRAGKPLWRLLADMSPEQLVAAADLRYLSDVLTREQAVALLADRETGRASNGSRSSRPAGYPCYTTSAGWLGYSDDKLRRLCEEAVAAGYKHVKLKVGADLDDDIRRCGIAREVLGPDGHLMIDANQVWDVPRGDRVGQGAGASSTRCGSRSRPVPTTFSVTPRSGRRSRRSASPPASTA